jgi:hypothetical protein
MAKYGLSTHIMKSYVSDFHGATVVVLERLRPDQPTNKPVCVDCHGIHAILPPTDGNSLVRTCQRCHPEASSSFAQAWLGHTPLNWQTAPLATAVRWFYAFLIPVTLGGMAFFVVTNAYQRVRQSSRKEAS